MRKLRIIAPLALSLLIPAYAGDKKKPEDAGITHQQADEILNELRQIRQLLENGARPSSGTAVEADGKIRMNLQGRPVLGKPDAPITMVEFTDYQCSFCQRFHTATFPEIRRQYIDTGKVRFISRDFPLEFHSNASRAAEAARCADDQHQFWAMRDQLVANATQLSSGDIEGYAQTLKLDMAAFKSCMASEKYSGAVKSDVAAAAALRIDGTPSFVIGKTTPDGVVGSVVTGALPIDAFTAKFEELSR